MGTCWRQKLAIFGAAVAVAIAYDVFAWVLIKSDPEARGLFSLGGWVGFFLLVMWYVPLAKGQLESTFFDRAAVTLVGVHALWVFVGDIILSPVPDPVYVAFLSTLFVVPVPVAFLVLLGLLLGRDRFEEPTYRVTYIPPPPPKPEPPRLHVEIERRRYTIERPKDRG